jgi:hypothetical protein
MLTHAEWQQQVVELAGLLGWEHLHVRKSVGRRGGGRAWQTTTNIKGWPDLLLWYPGAGFVAIEIKVKPDKPTPEQLAVLASLAAAGAVAIVAYPDDLDEVQALLTHGRGLR